jgi:hypothetical protein
MTIGSDTSFSTSPLYKQYTDTVEHKYTKATVFLTNIQANHISAKLWQWDLPIDFDFYKDYSS